MEFSDFIAKHAAKTQPRVSNSPITAEYTKQNCPRCGGSCTTEDRHGNLSSYKRSVVNGARGCPECHGDEAEKNYCDRCNGKGYILLFGVRTFDWACPACVSELRYGKSGRGHRVNYTR